MKHKEGAPGPLKAPKGFQEASEIREFNILPQPLLSLGSWGPSCTEHGAGPGQDDRGLRAPLQQPRASSGTFSDRPGPREATPGAQTCRGPLCLFQAPAMAVGAEAGLQGATVSSTLSVSASPGQDASGRHISPQPSAAQAPTPSSLISPRPPLPLSCLPPPLQPDRSF